MKKCLSKIRSKASYAVTAVTTALMMGMPVVHAEADNSSGTKLMEFAIKTIGKIAIVPAAFFLIMGIMHYSAANAEGDGPAKHKAVQQISAGIMIAVVAIILNLDVTVQMFVGLIAQ